MQFLIHYNILLKHYNAEISIYYIFDFTLGVEIDIHTYIYTLYTQYTSILLLID